MLPAGSIVRGCFFAVYYYYYHYHHHHHHPCYHLMHSIYNYIPETNPVSTIHSVAAVLYLQFVLHVMLFLSLNMFCTFTLALLAVCVQCPIWLFSVVPQFRALPATLLRCCLSDYEIVPVAPVITGITFAFTFHMR